MTKSSRTFKPISTLVVDFQPLMQFAIRTTLLGMGRINVIAAVHSTDDAVTALVNYKPDVILYNLVESASQIPKSIQRLIDAAQRMRAPAKICVYSVYPSLSLVAAALKAGAQGYLSTLHDGTSLQEMLLAVADGLPYENDDMRAALALTPPPDAEAQILRLTRRERQILNLIAEGATNRQIADALEIQLSTVKKHTGNIYVKLGVEHRSEALAFLMRNHLLSFLDGK